MAKSSQAGGVAKKLSGHASGLPRSAKPQPKAAELLERLKRDVNAFHAQTIAQIEGAIEAARRESAAS